MITPIAAIVALVAVAALGTAYAEHGNLTNTPNTPDHHWEFYNNHTMWPPHIYQPIKYWEYYPHEPTHTPIGPDRVQYIHKFDEHGNWDGRVHAVIDYAWEKTLQEAILIAIGPDGKSEILDLVAGYTEPLDDGYPIQVPKLYYTYFKAESGYHVAQITLQYSNITGSTNVEYFYHHMTDEEYLALIEEDWIIPRHPYANMTLDVFEDHKRFNNLLKKHSNIESAYHDKYHEYLISLNQTRVIQSELHALQDQQTRVEANARNAYWQAVTQSPGGIYLSVVDLVNATAPFTNSINDYPRPEYAEAPSQ